MQEVKDSLSKSLFGITTREAQLEGICVNCRQSALSNCYSDAGKREYMISGLCEKCFDKLMNIEEDD